MEALFNDGVLLEAAAAGPNASFRFPEWVLYSVKGVVGAACCLSILGASLIIFTYLAFPELRTTLRQILVNLSLADFLAAAANLVGLCINFYKYLDKETLELDDHYTVLQYVCKIQAGVSVIGTLAALTWTLSIAVYMFMFIVLKRPELANKLLPLHYVLSWGGPILLTIIFGSLDWLGFDPFTTPGYCDINAIHNKTTNYAPVILRYTLPIDLSVIILPPIFIVIRCYLQKMVKKSSQSFAGSESAVKSADKKLIFVPLIFVMLRIWNIISDPMLFYFHMSHSYPALFAVMFKGLGFSLQGFFNAVLYIGFTDQVRHRLCHAIARGIICCCSNSSQRGFRLSDKELKHSASAAINGEEEEGNSEKTALLSSLPTIDEDSRGFYRSL